MPFEPQKTPFHPEFGYNGPHLPYGTEPDPEATAPPIFEWDVEGTGDEHEFSETVEPVHEEPVVDAEPVVDEPVVEEPAVEEPVVEEPAEKTSDETAEEETTEAE